MDRDTHLTSIKTFAPGLIERTLDAAFAIKAKPPVFGIAGLPGSGKSTLAAQLAHAAKARGKFAVALSIDDFYLTRRERQALGRRVHPLLATRGPPGTHDVALACASIDRLKQMHDGECVRLPRFDKLSDQRLPPSRWRKIDRRPDLIVFEGWFLKVSPEREAALRSPINSLEQDEDADGRWRHFCNDALAAYAPLWQRIDRLLLLHAPGFGIARHWRWQQEQALQAARPKCRTMNQAQVEHFVMLFERVSRHALETLPAIADINIRLDAHRQEMD